MFSSRTLRNGFRTWIKTDSAKFLALPVVACFLYFDISILKVFEAANCWELIDGLYHDPLIVLMFVTLFLLSVTAKSWRLFMYGFVGLFCGPLDIFFFLLQGRALPYFWDWYPYWYPIHMFWYHFVVWAVFSVACALLVDLKVKKK